MKRPDLQLSAIQSDGPRRHPQPDGSVYVTATPCPVCNGPIEAGEWIAKIGTEDSGRSWAHRDCAQKAVDNAGLRNAWALIGADVARRPRAYSATQVRTVVEHLVQLVYRDELEEEQERVYSTEEAMTLVQFAAEGHTDI